MGFFVRRLPRWIVVRYLSPFCFYSLPSRHRSSLQPSSQHSRAWDLMPPTKYADSDSRPRQQSATVYMRYGTGGSFGSVTPMTTTGTQVQFTLTDLLASTVYNVQGALANETPFESDVSGTFTTWTPTITGASDSEVTHNSAKITVTVSNPNSTTVYLQYKKTADLSFTSLPSKATTTTNTSEEVEFSLS